MSRAAALRCRAALAAAGLLAVAPGCAPATGPAPVAAAAAAAPTAAPTATPTAAAGSVPGSGPPAGRPASSAPARPPRPGGPPAPAAPRPGAARTRLVVLDPGHNGGNAAHPSAVTRLVAAGNGRTKPCNTVGASTAAGYPEHAFAWDVAVRTRALLAARGVRVALTRPDDRGVGPCVDVRGRFGGTVRADAVVSVHADGADPGGAGFHVIEASRAPAGPANAAAAHRLALSLLGALRTGSGLGIASYVAGGDGLDARDDLAGLNLATRPAIVVEAGNMRNAGDAAVQSSPAGRQRIAAAIAAGILGYLSSTP